MCRTVTWTIGNCRLHIRAVTDFITLAEGESAVSGVLDDFDPRRFGNGFYVLKLTARDIGGRKTTLTQAIEIKTATSWANISARILT